MKVLFACIEAPTYSSIGMVDGFEKLGFEVVIFDWQKCRLNAGTQGMRERFVTKAYMEQPDLIFMQIQNPDAIDVNTAIELQNIANVINYTFDTRNDIKWYKELSPHIHLTLFGSYDEVNECKKEGIENVGYMQSSYNHIWYKLRPKTEKNYGEIIFLGNNYLNTNLDFPKAQHRYDMIEFMGKEYGEKFKVYGMGWEKICQTKMLNPQESIEAMNNAKVVITQNNFKRSGYTSDRIWNAIGCGAAVVAEYYNGFENDFDIKNNHAHPFTWSHFEQLKTYCDKLISEEYSTYRRIYANEIHKYAEESLQWKNRFKEIPIWKKIEGYIHEANSI